MSEVRVLLIDANAEDQSWVGTLTATASEIALHWEASLDAALANVPVDAFDLLLLDDDLGRRDGADLVRLTRERGWTRPTVVLATRPDEAAAMRALRAGADDYIVKQQITATGFIRAVRSAVERDRSANKIALQARMLDAAEARLRQAQKLEAVGQLAGGIAHDFNNLLTAIRGYGDIVRSGLPPTHALQHELTELIAATDRAAGLTQRLLAFSRRQVLKPRLIDMASVARGMEPSLRAMFATGDAFSVQVSSDLPRVSADSAQIEHVITVLVENARDATSHGGSVTLAIEPAVIDQAFASSHLGSKPGDWVRVTVSDTGIGMSPAVRARLFEPFFTTKELGGGLGLATAYGIVQQSGGFMEVASSESSGRGALVKGEAAGTRFDVYLPVAQTTPLQVALTAGAGQSSARILVVEDSLPVRTVVVRTLRKAGFEVLEASDGVEGLELASAAEGAIQLVLADRQMPRMDGWELASRLRESGGSASPPPVLIMSGDTPEALGIARLPDGVHFIAKPFSGSTLLEVVRSILDGSAEPSTIRM